MVTTTLQLPLSKPELRFCAGSNPACPMLEFAMVTIIQDENKTKFRSSVNHTTKTNHHHHSHQRIVFHCKHNGLITKWYSSALLTKNAWMEKTSTYGMITLIGNVAFTLQTKRK